MSPYNRRSFLCNQLTKVHQIPKALRLLVQVMPGVCSKKGLLLAMKYA